MPAFSSGSNIVLLIWSSDISWYVVNIPAIWWRDVDSKSTPLASGWHRRRWNRIFQQHHTSLCTDHDCNRRRRQVFQLCHLNHRVKLCLGHGKQSVRQVSALRCSVLLLVVCIFLFSGINCAFWSACHKWRLSHAYQYQHSYELDGWRGMWGS